MSETVRTDLDSFSEDIRELLPLESNDTVEGVYDDVLFQISYSPPTWVEELCFRGEFVISVFSPEGDVDTEGGIVFYSERHKKPDGYINESLRKLFSRAYNIAVRISTDNDLYACPYCGFMASEEYRIEKRLPVFSRNPLKRSVPVYGDDPCVGLSSWLPPRVEVLPHDSSVNPLFDSEELKSCDSLVSTRGYPGWAYESEQIDSMANHRLRSLAEEHPEMFDDDIDVETVKRVLGELDYFYYGSAVNRRNFTSYDSDVEGIQNR